ncbi:GNAT family N-acetyltransferase [Vannielia litorea]|uniref:GNAT family N-acetyltransferase n=1 Tax=Vannielia litorea TaxID=1217970 RepID=UPI001C963B83|nr:GNAT family N-acetyltransferase [Vannielia litorea]MBY6047557.1 GNAT family N-acetyltransferase [Vannielia litorea]MBY6074971.1 GNAT family N-acetyltransferase [Vannielia litorea]MBY6152507.1 GNAT family N-acetyltransferase [Vannielia litorea]
MSAQIHLAGPDDADRVLSMVARFHEEFGLDLSDEHRASAVLPLLEGNPLGAIYLIGPRRAPVGYICVCFGWAIEMGGIDGFIDEFWIRPSVRGRGIGAEALHKLLPALAAAGVRFMHMEVDRDDEKAQRLYRRSGFELRERYVLMSKDLSKPLKA